MELKWNVDGKHCISTNVQDYKIVIFHGLITNNTSCSWFIDTSSKVVARGRGLTKELAIEIASITVKNIIEGERKDDEQIYYNDYGDVDGKLYGVRRRQ